MLYRARATGVRWFNSLSLAVMIFMVSGLLCVSAGIPRSLSFNRYAPEQGLSQSAVNTILQDSKGFLWFGTEEGLNRFDGYRFQIFRGGEDGQLSHGFINDVIETRDGEYWIATREGLTQLHTNLQSSKIFKQGSYESGGLPGMEVYEVHESQDKTLWVLTSKGIAVADESRNKFKLVFPVKAETIYEDQENRIWIGAEQALYLWNHPSKNAIKVRDWESPISAIYQSSEGLLWIGDVEGALTSWDPQTIEREPMPALDTKQITGRIWEITEDKSGTLWIATEKGLVAINKQRNDIYVYRHKALDSRSISHDSVLSIYVDQGSVLWTGTTAGINKVHLGSSRFRSIHVDGTDQGLSNSMVAAFYEDHDGFVWIGTFGGGMERWDPATGRFKHYRHETNRRGSLPDDRVTALLRKSSGELYVGTVLGLVRMTSDGTFQRVLPGGVTALLEGKGGDLWVATFENGVFRIAEDGTRHSFKHDPDNAGTLHSTTAISLFQDRQGGIWVGGFERGISRINPTDNSVKRYSKDGVHKEDKPVDTAYAFHEDRHGNLWIGSKEGLLCWESNHRAHDHYHVKRYTTADGLPNQTVYGVLADENGAIWLSTNRGLSRFSPTDEIFDNYDLSHGLQGVEFNLGAFHRGKRGAMYFGGTEGFTTFYPGDMRRSDHIPKVIVSSIRQMNEPLNSNIPPWQIETLTLNHEDSLVTFEFSALDYAAPEKNQYAYKLEGFHEDWIELGDARQANFAKLPAGRYTLKVKGTNSDGLWSEDGQSIDIIVKPPLWRSKAAYVLYVLLVGGFIYLLYRAQVNKLRREEENSRMLEREVQSRTEELAKSNSQLKRAIDQLETAAFTDAHTGLFNRRYLMTEIESEVTAVTEQKLNRNFMFLMIDLDGLKKMNDVYGHDAGDSVILQTAELLKNTCRGGDSIVRWGGDEFLVVSRNVDRDACEQLAKRIRDRIRLNEFVIPGGERVRLSCSIGFALHPFIKSTPKAVTAGQVLGIADRALYLGKMSGRNMWAGLYSTARTDGANLLDRVNNSLRESIENDELELVSSENFELHEYRWERAS